MKHFKLILAFLSIAFGAQLLQAQTFTSYFTGDTADVQTSPTGGVCLMGGAGEHDSAMVWWLQRADGGDVVVIRASGSDGYNNYLYSQLGVTVNSVETIVFDDDLAVNDPYVIQQLSRAEAIWIAGGDQWDYVRAWRDSPVDSILNLRIAAGAPIGGISAGMAVLGGIYFSAQYGTITSATALQNPYASTAAIDSVTFLKAPFLQNVITDTHYDDPDRRGRHTAFLAQAFTEFTLEVKGIACDEYAAVCIAPDGKAYCYGDAPNYTDYVYFIRPNCDLPDPSPEVCQPGTPLTWDHMGAAVKVYRVRADNSGTQFLDLNDWKTGAGGTWREWSVSNGNWGFQAAQPIVCSVVSRREEAVSLGMDLYPNPVAHTLRVRWYEESGRTKIELWDELGRGVEVPVKWGNGMAELEMRGLATGLYVLRLSDGKGRSSQQKIMVAR